MSKHSEGIETVWQIIKQKYAQQYLNGLKSNHLAIGQFDMKFKYFFHGDRPEGGYTLIFGFHGGGGCPAQANDQQYENHQHLYDSCLPKGCIWFVPRSCENVWDMWFRPYLEDFLEKIIQGLVLNETVNPNKVFLTGYSAGGDGIYHMAPRMADQLAGAAMMAGHPNGVQLYNLRNIPFSIQVGGKDTAYERNQHAKTYIKKIKELRQTYGGQFDERASNVFEECGHWMKSKDALIFPKLFSFKRNPYPDVVLFKQHPRRPKNHLYYVKVEPNHHKSLLTVKREGTNTFYIESQQMNVYILVNEKFVNYWQNIQIIHNGKLTVNRKPIINQELMMSTAEEWRDQEYIFQDQFQSHPNMISF